MGVVWMEVGELSVHGDFLTSIQPFTVSVNVGVVPECMKYVVGHVMNKFGN